MAPVGLADLRLNGNLLHAPPYVRGKPVEEVQEEFGLSDVVKLASNESPFGASPLALAALQDALKDVHRYPGHADRRLQQKLSVYYNACYGTSFTDANFLTGNGLTAVLRMIAEAFIFDGGEAVVCTPTFPLYQILVQRYGGTCRQVPHRHYRYDLAAMADAITPDTRLVFLCNPNNPTGTLVTRDEANEFLGRIPPSVVVVFDEPYADFVDDPEYGSAVEYVDRGRDQIVVLRSFSKIYGLANLRIGYAVGTAGMIEYLGRARLPFDMSDLVACAGLAALQDQNHVETVRQVIAVEKVFLYEGLASLGLNYVPSQANFVLIVGLSGSAGEVSRALLRQGIIVRPWADLPGSIRVTIGTRRENERLLRALREI